MSPISRLIGRKCQRVEKVGGGNTIVTIFLGNQVLAEYYNGAAPSAPTNEYIYAGSLRVASIQSGTTNYWHNDHLSPRVTTDTSGNVSGQRGTFPFGETWYSPSGAAYVFTTYYRDSESGNDYAQARTYVGGLGRFSSPDPVSGSTSDPQSLNRYSYVRNMPHWLSDPLGLTPSCNTAKRGDSDQQQDSKSGGGPSGTDSGDPSEAEPQNASQDPCDQDPWYYGGGGNGVSIDGGEGFDPGDGAGGLTGIGSDAFSILNAAFAVTGYETVDNPDCLNGDCPGGVGEESITVPVYGNFDLLSLLGGPGGNSSGGANGVNKNFSLTTPCAASAGQVMGAVEGNFSRFGNYSAGPFSVTFSPPSGIGVGSTIPISVGYFGMTQNMGVSVQSISSQSMTFNTLPGGHLLYPASITFAASPASARAINFNISLTGNFNGGTNEAKYYAGGALLENAQWNHFLDQIKAFCKTGH